ncbi:MAG: hypothetical protein RBT70_06740 [Alphaproteobacteria bacterium]|nr:hypothetical protein [Alphaproteobacteria bacterium]
MANMLKALVDAVKAYWNSLGTKVDPLAAELGLLSVERPQLDRNKNSVAMMQSLVGGMVGVADYYFPADILGGCCPRIQGEEQNIVWNAAAEALDTERVHLVWQAKKDKIYYLAVSSESIRSHPNTWCPFCSLLPGMDDAAIPPTIYTHYSEEVATMMAITSDSLTIHRGTSSVIRAKAERLARENNNAPLIDMVPDLIQSLQPVPWYSVSLFEDRARRILSTLMVSSAIIFTTIALFVWFVAAVSTLNAKVDLEEIRERSNVKTIELMKKVQEHRASPMRKQIASFADLNDGLLALNGYLEMYQIVKGRVLWRAIVPGNVTAERIKELGGQTLGNADMGVIIGNSPDALGSDRSGDSKGRGGRRR